MPISRRLTSADAPVLCGATACAIGMLALLGWILNVDQLKSLLPGITTIKANAAVSFVVSGAGLVLVSRSEPGSRGRSIGLACLTIGAVVGLATLAEYLTGRAVGIDQLLFPETPGQIGTAAPGRMSPLTAICMVLVALAIAVSAKRPRITVGLAAVALGVCVLNVFDIAFNAAVPSFLAGFTQMALGSALAMGLTSVGAIGLLGSRNPFTELSGASPSAHLLQRLFAATVATPLVLIMLTLTGQNLGLFDASYGNSLRLLGMLWIGVTAILFAARSVRGIDATREALEIERDRFFDLSLDMLSVTGLEGRFERVNGAWHAAMGYPPGELIGRRAVELVHPDDLERTLDIARRHHHDGERLEGFQNRYRHGDGSYRWLEWMSQTSPDGHLSFGIARDVTDRKAGEDRRARREQLLGRRNQVLAERAVLDPLTGLHNRRYFDAEVARMERRWRRLPAGLTLPVSVIMFDLDHFGDVNNEHGHQAGDAVLRVFARLLKRRFRDTDLVGRYGGEEFVAVLEGATCADAIRVADGLRTDLEAESIDIRTGTPLRVTVSAGCSQLADVRSVSAGLSVADVWLSQAKRAGRNQVVGL